MTAEENLISQMKEKIKKLLHYKMKFSNVDRMLKKLDRIILKQPDKEDKEKAKPKKLEAKTVKFKTEEKKSN